VHLDCFDYLADHFVVFFVDLPSVLAGIEVLPYSLQLGHIDLLPILLVVYLLPLERQGLLQSRIILHSVMCLTVVIELVCPLNRPRLLPLALPIKEDVGHVGGWEELDVLESMLVGVFKALSDVFSLQLLIEA